MRGRRPLASALAALLAAGALCVTTAPAHASGPAGPSGTSPSATRHGGTDPLQAALDSARTSGRPVPIDALTDTATTVVANPDGTFTRSESSSPQRVRQNGRWVPIDTTLVRRPDGTYAPRAATTQVTFSGGGSGALVTLADGSDAVGFSWPGTLPAPTVSGDTATYPDVLPQVDLQLTADAAGYSSVLVVKSARAAADPALQRLTLGTTSSPRLALSGTAQGGAQATDTVTGRTVFHSDTPLMWDSTPTTAADASRLAGAAAAAGSTSALRARAERSASAVLGAHRARIAVAFAKGRQTLTLDRALLAAGTTKYPVYVDPEWSGSPGKSQLDWARISDNGWNVYNSTATTGANNARAGWDNNNPGNGERARTYYAMNTAGIKSAVVTKADLYVNQLSAASCASTPAAVYGTAAVGGWNSSGLSWGHEPTRQTGVIATASSHEAGTCPTKAGSKSYVSPPTLDFNVTSRIQSAAAGKWPYATLLVEAANMNDATQWKQLGFGGGATLSVTYTYRPKLKDGTGDPAVHPSVVDMGKTLTTTHTPTLSARAIDPDLAGGSETLHILYDVFNSGGTLVSSGYGPSSGYNANGSDWTTGTLADGTYTWKATAQNSSGYWVSSTGTWTATQTFTVDTTAPHAPTVASTQFPGNQIGSAFTDTGTFVVGNDRTNNVMGYLFSLDGNLSNITYAANRGTAWTTSTVLKPGTVYYATADNKTGTGTAVVNGDAALAFPPGTVGPHTLYAKAVDQAGSTSPQTSYLFYAGASTPAYAYGDKMATGWSATNTDGTTTTVPAATISSAGGYLRTQANLSGVNFGDGAQGMLSNNTANNTKVAVGDSAVFSFDIPQTGPWDIGASLTKATDYGVYKLTLDAGTPNATVLTSGFDAYNAVVSTQYIDLGIPKDSTGALQTLSQGLHTLTLTLTGKNSASTGYQAGIDTLRLGPAATCPINSTTGCLNNTAVSTYTGGTTPTVSKADADGRGDSLNAADLTAAGWAGGQSVTVDGATVKLPAFGNGTSDNMLASGQVVTVPSTGVVNQGNAVVFLGFATAGTAKGATGTITYSDPGCPLPSQRYTLDAVPDWISPVAGTAALTVGHENKSTNTQSTVSGGLYAFSVPLDCPGSTVRDITLPLWSNGVQGGQNSIHFLGLGIRASSATATRHWVGTWSDAQDSGHIQSQPATGSAVDASLNKQTVRIPVHVSVGGDNDGQVRIHLSDLRGTLPVKFDAASVALQDGTSGGATAAAAPLPLTFGAGQSTSTTVPAGGDVTSNPVTLHVPQQATLLVSLQVDGAPASLAGHALAGTPVYASGTDGVDHTKETAATSYTLTTMTGIPFLSAVDVSTPVGNPTGAVVLYGDRTINADTSGSDGRGHLSDAISTALAADPDSEGSVEYGVLNAGSSATDVGPGLLPPPLGSAEPLSAMNPLDSAALAQSGVRTVLISKGTDDLLKCTGTDVNQCAVAVESGLVAETSAIKSFYNDDSLNLNVQTGSTTGQITVYVATIPPFTATHTATQEAAREAVNLFVTGDGSGAYLNGAADGVIDFAAAVSTAGDDVSDTVKTADLSGGAPDAAYTADLAAQYLSDSADPYIPQPNSGDPGGSTGEDEWKLTTDGSDTTGQNPATAYGAVTFSADAPASPTADGGSAAFDGSTGYLRTTTAAVNTLNDYTISLWVKLNDGSNTVNALCQGTTAHQALYIGYDSGNQGWAFQTTTTNDDNAQWPTAEGDFGSAELNTWTHLVATYTAPVAGDDSTGVMTLYVNGSLMGTDVNLTPQYDPNLPMTVGACRNTAVYGETPYTAFPGQVTDVHTYGFAMAADQIAAMD
ncbi:LamG-like jellyroll fold domain-containing protein [Actinacidiphila rubida]|uniref:Concanavalin A-like lectin/glucanases superfamily protein n=1 Tax=Actinacidiphila rubida TaxID=310780 RepID=A0A1H8J1N0_9ACTN|nr:LamG-like jellyroll fold domain-containing protein [Actinacidiphila rubida]SEN74569.1 Concanavalin A-like lectin/glucanases superfamily protein [Actinacidiphila rubida]